MLYSLISGYVWVEVEEGKIVDMADGNHYAGCRCQVTQHPLNKCKNFESCLDSILNKFKEEDVEKYNKLINAIK